MRRLHWEEGSGRLDLPMRSVTPTVRRPIIRKHRLSPFARQDLMFEAQCPVSHFLGP